MNTSESPLLIKSKQLAIGVIHLVKDIPETLVGRTIAKQLVRSATSVALIIDRRAGADQNPNS